MSKGEKPRRALYGMTNPMNNRKTMIYCKDSITLVGPLALL